MHVGLWDNKTLVELRSFELSDEEGIKNCLKGFNVGELNLVHETNLFMQSEKDSSNASEFDSFFPADLARLTADSHTRKSEKLKRQNVYSHSYVSHKIEQAAKNLHSKTKLNHISTAMGNYALNSKDHILVLVGDKKMNLLVHKNKFLFT